MYNHFILALFADDQINREFPKGYARIIAIELMYNIQKFCKSSSFNVQQSGAVLSMFYLIHRYFTSSLHVTPDKIYTYFKEFVLHHSVSVLN